MLGIAEEYGEFDTDIIMCINSVFSVLAQLGAGPKEGFMISDESAVWSDFLKGNVHLELIKTYVFLKVKLMFDPPSSSAVIESTERQISELEWRINHEAESDAESSE